MKQSGHPARANASKRTPKRESRPGEPAIGAAGKKLPLKNLPGEASDRCRSAKRHSFEWRFVLEGVRGRNPRSECGNKQLLPAGCLRCSIEVAYYAADAGHPVFGQGKLAAEPAGLRVQLIPKPAARGPGSHRKGHTREKQWLVRVHPEKRMEKINGMCAGCGPGIFQRVGNGGRGSVRRYASGRKALPAHEAGNLLRKRRTAIELNFRDPFPGHGR
jgi:hypothetical protein